MVVTVTSPVASGDEHRIEQDAWFNDHSLPGLRNRLSRSIEAVKRQFALSPSSRVSEWGPLLTVLGQADARGLFTDFVGALDNASWTHPYKVHIRALVEVRTFVEIIEQLLPDLTNTDLRDIISGPLDPANEQQKSRARDLEFELFVAAICRRAGLAVSLREPDIVVDFADSEWAIAAKRLSSPKLAGANVSKAARQIRDSGHHGFVFLDVTRILEPKYEFVTHWRSVEAVIGGHLLAFVRDYAQALQKADNGVVRGVVLRAAFPHMSQGLRLGTSEHWWAVGLRSLDGSELNAFLRRFGQGLRGV